MSFAFINDRILPMEEATVLLNNQQLFKDGVFTSIGLKNGKIECLERHLNRLKFDCESLDIIFPDIKRSLLWELIERAGVTQGLWKMKMIITVCNNLRKKFRAHRHFVITFVPYRLQEKPFSLALYPHVIQKPNAWIKSLDNLDRHLLQEYARKQNVDDTITTTDQDELLETAICNIFWCEGINFYTPNPSLPLLKGISLSVMVTAAEKLNMKVHYVHNKLSDISEHSHLFVSNAMIGFQPVVKVGERFFNRNLDLEKTLWSAREAIISEE